MYYVIAIDICWKSMQTLNCNGQPITGYKRLLPTATRRGLRAAVAAAAF